MLMSKGPGSARDDERQPAAQPAEQPTAQPAAQPAAQPVAHLKKRARPLRRVGRIARLAHASPVTLVPRAELLTLWGGIWL